MKRLVCLVFLLSVACGAEEPSRNEVTDPGRGPENRGSLDTFDNASYAALGSGKGRRVDGLVEWRGQHVMRVTYEEPSLPVEMIGQRRYEESLYRVGTLEGGQTRYRTLLVPKLVRAGMKWQARANEDDAVTSNFEVVGRRLVQGPNGEAPAWHIRERSGRAIDRVYVEGWGFIGIGTLDDVDELLRYEHNLGLWHSPSLSAPPVPLEGEGVPLAHDGAPMRLTHGAAFQLVEEGASSLYVEGVCGDRPCDLCVALGPQTGAPGAPSCPARLAGKVAVVQGSDGPTFAVAEDAEVVFWDANGSAQALRLADVGMEAQQLPGGAPRQLVGGWDPILRTDLDHGLRWSVGPTVFLAGRVSLATSDVRDSAVEQPTLIGSFSGTLHGSVGPKGHGVLHTSPDGTISRIAEIEGKHLLLDLGTVQLPAGHRLAGAWPLAGGRAVVITTSDHASFLWTADLPGDGVARIFSLGTIGRTEGDDLVACVVDSYAQSHQRLVPEGNRCILSLGDEERRGTPAARRFDDRGLQFVAANSDHKGDSLLLEPGVAGFVDGFVSKTHRFRRSGISLGAPEGAHTTGLLGGGVPDLDGGLWIPFAEPEEAGGRAGLVHLGYGFRQVVLGRGDAPQILFQRVQGGVVVALQGTMNVLSIHGEPEKLYPLGREGEHITVRGVDHGNTLCGTLKRPTENEPDKLSTYAFCEWQRGSLHEELELGVGVELRGLEGEAWTPLVHGFLAVREEGGARELVLVQQRIVDREDWPGTFKMVLDIIPAPLELRTVGGRQYPRALFHANAVYLWMVHIDEKGEEFVAVLTSESFRRQPYRVEGAHRIEAVFPNQDFTFLRVVMDEACDQSSCVEDVRVVRLPTVPISPKED